MKIGPQLKKWRENRGMSFYKVEKYTSVPADYVKKIEESTEENEPNITLDTLERLALGVGVPPAELVNQDSEATYLADFEQEYIKVLRRYNKEEQEAIYKALDAISNKDK